jgi:hypothetical protein
MGLEIFFQCESLTFPVAAEPLSLVLYDVFGSVWWCFMVTFNVAKRHHQCC